MHHQTPHEIQVRHDQLMGLETELLIHNEMVSDQDRSLHMIRVTNWLFQLYCLVILHPRHKLVSGNVPGWIINPNKKYGLFSKFSLAVIGAYEVAKKPHIFITRQNQHIQ